MRYDKFEGFVRYLDGEVEYVVGYMSLEFRSNV